MSRINFCFVIFLWCNAFDFAIGQVVCQVIEPVPCPAGNPKSCGLTSCRLNIFGLCQCPTGSEETERLNNTVNGVRPANPGEFGFFDAVLDSEVKCERKRLCKVGGCNPSVFAEGDPVCKA